MTWRPERGWGFDTREHKRLEILEERIERLEKQKLGKASGGA
jgi:hypothetical protein